MGRCKPLLLLLSHFSRVQLCEILSLEFSRQEHWSGLPFPSPMYKSEKWKWSRSGLTEFIPFMCNSDIWGKSCFLVHPASWHFHSSSAITMLGGVGSIPWITVLGALIHIWRPEISHWWLWHFLLINMAEDIFISHSPAKYFEALPRSYCNTGGPKSFTEANH